MRVLTCSGRFYADTHTITHMLDLYARIQTINVLIHGGRQALGDTIEDWTREADVHVIRRPTNWALHGKYAKTRCDSFMLEDSRPDVSLTLPGREDTVECTKMAKNRGVRATGVI